MAETQSKCSLTCLIGFASTSDSERRRNESHPWLYLASRQGRSGTTGTRGIFRGPSLDPGTASAG